MRIISKASLVVPHLILVAVLLPTASAAEKSTGYADELDRLLGEYVSAEGVDYKSWRKSDEDVEALGDVLKAMGNVDLDGANADEQKAFYINLYNVGMIQRVLEEYPIKSVKEIAPDLGVFEEKFIQVGGEKASLEMIEKGVLLKKWDDPRIHFAVNCASVSCPPLAQKAFRGNDLDETLDELAKSFAQSKRAARVDSKRKVVAYSQLFDWYAEDFGTEDPREYLNRYRSEPIPSGLKKDWIQYDWSLNEAK